MSKLTDEVREALEAGRRGRYVDAGTACHDGCAEMPQCLTCGRTKKPNGRDAPPSSSYCDSDCRGYWDSPSPGHLWPVEWEDWKAWQALKDRALDWLEPLCDALEAMDRVVRSFQDALGQVSRERDAAEWERDRLYAALESAAKASDELASAPECSLQTRGMLAIYSKNLRAIATNSETDLRTPPTEEP